MKKGIILEQHRKYTILLTKDGAFEKGIVLEKKAEVGEEVNYKPLKKSFIIMKMDLKHLPLRVLSVACIFMLFFIPYYFFPTEKTYAYVTVDINPSVEIEIDEEYMVQSIRPVNADASILTEHLNNVKKKALEEVIQMIIHKSEEMDLVNEDKNVLVGISFLDDEKMDDKREIIHELEEQVVHVEPDWNFAMFHVPEEIRVLADETETSMNKMLANQFTNNADSEENFHTDYVIDDKELEFISTFYQPKNGKDGKRIEIMSDPNDDTQSSDEHIEENIESDEISIENVPNLEESDKEAKEEEEKESFPSDASRSGEESESSMNETEIHENQNDCHVDDYDEHSNDKISNNAE